MGAPATDVLDDRAAGAHAPTQTHRLRLTPNRRAWIEWRHCLDFPIGDNSSTIVIVIQ